MRTIIAGSRSIRDYNVVLGAVAQAGFNITEVVSGGARGVDSLGERWAQENNLPCRVFLADWAKYRNAAGPIRNTEMCKHADALIACWDGQSAGTRDIIAKASVAGLKVYVHRTDMLETAIS